MSASWPLALLWKVKTEQFLVCARLSEEVEALDVCVCLHVDGAGVTSLSSLALRSP